MSAEQNISPEEIELLSAYLDNMLNEAERSALEARLMGNEALRAELEALRATVALIKGLPTLKAPRNFILTPEMVKGKTETGSPQMVKGKTEVDTPQMVKGKTETGRIMRFPSSAVMSAAASFVIIILGIILVFGTSIAPNATPSTESNSIALMTTIMPDQEASSSMNDMGAGATDNDTPSDDVNVQRAMPTATLNTATTGMVVMPSPTVMTLAEMAVQQEQENQSFVPVAPMVESNMTQMAYAVPMESQMVTETISAIMPMPASTISATQEAPSVANTITEEMMMDTMMSVASAETTPSLDIIEVMGNAVLPTETAILTLEQPESIPTPKADDLAPAVDIVPLIGVFLIAIGITSLVLVILRSVRGRA